MPLESSGSDRVTSTLSRELSDRLEMIRELVKTTFEDANQQTTALKMLETERIIDRGVKAYLEGFVSEYLQTLPE